MMERLKLIGKLMALTLLASGLLFAGCMQGGDSDESSTAATHGPNWIPMELDVDNGELIIGDNGLGQGTGTFDGHVVEVTNGSTGCAQNGDDIKCWVQVINRDASMYMANVLVYTSYCLEGAATFDHADFICTGGVCVDADGPVVCDDGNSCGALGTVNGGGMMYVEDGNYSTVPRPSNSAGGITFVHKTGRKPYQMIAPECGSRSAVWDFSGVTSGNYGFFAQVDADWRTFDFASDARITGTDLNNRSTTFIMITDLADNHGGLNDWYHLGSYQRSNVVAGYGAGSNKATVAPGDYFGVNVAVEYPNHMETNCHADIPCHGGAQNFFWYQNFSVILKFDPTIVARNTVDGVTRKAKLGGVNIPGNFVYQCNLGATVMGKSCFTGYDDPNLNSAYNDTDGGWISSYIQIQGANFSFFPNGGTYTHLDGVQVWHYVGTSGFAMPAHLAQKGINRIAKVPTHGWTTPGYSNAFGYAASGVIQEMQDPDPDMPFGMQIFKVLPGTVGKGAEFRADQFASWNTPILFHSNGTWAGGQVGGSDDWNQPCYPQDGANQGCDDAKINLDYYIHKSAEQSNPNLETGPNVPSFGGYQAWNVYICVQ